MSGTACVRASWVRNSLTAQEKMKRRGSGAVCADAVLLCCLRCVVVVLKDKLIINYALVECVISLCYNLVCINAGYSELVCTGES